ncbi:chalcone isomerase family protein [Pusillimonas minor]|uniref:Chalcone isomerase family protein n=1 Tax=Pusillimonas minor TaxID=2697024 RepID=A0A842HSV9_9BURK|nr:chalcone isomerase family protein [Pusillimonas minor]MBC2769905.1 chalcone isomerase family protein [Pusillimonas minor]
MSGVNVIRRVLSGLPVVLALMGLAAMAGAQTQPNGGQGVGQAPSVSSNRLQETPVQPTASGSSAAGPAAVKAPTEVVAALGQPSLQGQKRFRWFAFSVYDIRLWLSPGATPDALFNAPFALELDYARSLKGEAIAQRSIEEMSNLDTISPDEQADWLALMTRAFPDVAEGDRLTGVWRPGGTVEFFFNGKQTASVENARFGRLFFGIWLSEKTSEPAMRSALLGQL